MTRGLLTASVCLLGLALTAGPAAADDVKPAKKADPTAALLEKLRQPVTFEGDLTATLLPELTASLAKKYEINIVIRTDLFKAEGEPNVGDRRPDLGLFRLDGVTLRQFLDLVLGGMNATYLIRKGMIEIVPVRYSAKETGSEVKVSGDEAVRLAEPLVSVVYKERPLNEAIADLAEEFDLNVVVAPQAGDSRMAFVSARLLNVPADKALELIALQADLRVVRKGTAFLVTSRDHANELFAEPLEKEKMKAEVERFRKGLEVPQVPPPATIPPPVEKKD